MKLCLNTHNLVGELSLEEIIEVCVAQGLGGIEFSVGYGHKHGVELDTPAQLLEQKAEAIAAAGLETVSIATYCRFDMADEAMFAVNMANAKKGILLAHAMRCTTFRFVGNDLPGFMSRKAFILRIAAVMQELADYAKEYGVTVLLNMHGSFNYRHDVAEAVEQCGRKNCGLVYNCDDSDLINGSPEITLSRIGPYISHVHLHSMLGSFPYQQLFARLRQQGYNGWYSIVVDDPSPQPEVFIGYYARLCRALYVLP